MPSRRACSLKELADLVAKWNQLALRFLLDTSAMSGKNVQRLFEGVAELLPDEPFVPQQRGLQVTTNLASTSTQDNKQPARRCCG